MSIRAVVFDRDGVLTYFDFAPVVALLREIPMPLAEARARWERWCAQSAPPASLEAEQRHLTGFWGALAEELSLGAEFRERLRAFDYKRTIRAFDDARPTLEAVRARGLLVGVLSNFPLASLEAALAAVGLLELVDVAAAAPVIGASKPAPAVYRYVLAALGVAPEESLLVDDEEPCVIGARAVGMHACLLDRSVDAGAFRGTNVVKDLGGVLERVDSLTSRLSEGAVSRV